MIPSPISEHVSFDACVDRRLVHRKAVGEVFVTSVVPVEDRRWRCGVQFSRGHRRMPPAGGPLPISLLVEASRQAGLAISHAGLAVELDQHYLLDEFSVTFLGDHPVVPCDAPFEAELDIAVTSVQCRQGKVCGLTFAGSWTVANQVFATATAAMRCMSAGNYRALRRNAPVADPPVAVPTAPLSASPTGQLTVGWEPYDPLLFDHPHDHVPGIAFIDAILSIDPMPQELRARFHQIPELNEPVHARIETTSSVTTFTFTQISGIVATGEITCRS